MWECSANTIKKYCKELGTPDVHKCSLNEVFKTASTRSNTFENKENVGAMLDAKLNYLRIMEYFATWHTMICFPKPLFKRNEVYSKIEYFGANVAREHCVIWYTT